jgi:putative ABC transport system permease protein
MSIIFLDLWEGVKIALQALRANKLRFTLTTLGIVIGVTTVIIIVSIIQGLNKAFEKEISSIGTDTLFIQKFPWVMDGEDWAIYRNRRDLTMREYEAVSEHATLASAVAPTLRTRRRVKHSDVALDEIIITGTTDAYTVTSNAQPAAGRFLSPGDVEHRRSVCVLGAEVAEKLFGGEEPIGHRISVGGYKFRVVGVLEKRGKIFDFNPDLLVMMPIGTFEKVFGRERSIDIQIKVATMARLEETQDQLTGIMRRVRKLGPGDSDDFAINQQSMLSDLYNSLTAGLWAVAIGVGSISLLVGGIGIMNIMLVSVTERTREIGTRKAIGAKRSDILWQFLVEAMMVCGLGVVIGLIIAVGIVILVAKFSPLPAAITPWVAVLGLGFTVALGLFFGIYPASKAARLNPIEALRYE